MLLEKLGLSARQKAWRANVIGGSDANIIMSGQSEDLYRLWQLKRGLIEPDNLDDVLPVIMGQFTEELNRAWFEKKTGRAVTNAGEERLSLDFPHMACTLDGLTDQGETVWEAKHVSAFFKEDDILQKYMPQLHHNMIVCDVQQAVLSVFFGNAKWVHWDVEFDGPYARALVEREEAFFSAVQSGHPPCAMPEVQTPAQKAEGRSVILDLSDSATFAELASSWKADKPAAARLEKTVKKMKSLMADDVLEASGHGLVMRFDRANRLSIKEAA